MTLWAKTCCRILGIRVKSSGSPFDRTAHFVVSNHCSYLDILVIGSLMPVVFVSKKEVASWPFLGRLVQLAGTVFVDRESKASAPAVLEDMRKRVEGGVSVAVFPEGTTNDGISMKDFKSALFHLPATLNIPILPVSIRYTHKNGIPLKKADMDNIAWYGGMEFLPHFRNLISIKRIDVNVRFHPSFSAFAGERKALSSFSCEIVREGHRLIGSDMLLDQNSQKS